MSFSATRLALSHVGATGDQGPDLAACTDPQVHRLFWRGQPGHGPVCTQDVQDVQCRNLLAFPRATALSANARPAHDHRAGQCALPSRQTPGSISAPAYFPAEASVSATLQPTTRPDRAGVEAHSAPSDAQPLLRHARRLSPGRQHLLRPLAPTEPNPAQTMLHYLRRCV
jgi:hypothetical protein